MAFITYADISSRTELQDIPQEFIDARLRIIKAQLKAVGLVWPAVTEIRKIKVGPRLQSIFRIQPLQGNPTSLKLKEYGTGYDQTLDLDSDYTLSPHPYLDDVNFRIELLDVSGFYGHITAINSPMYLEITGTWGTGSDSVQPELIDAIVGYIQRFYEFESQGRQVITRSKTGDSDISYGNGGNPVKVDVNSILTDSEAATVISLFLADVW
ncbi:MAG: hypothetical protein OHK0017_07810 [Patescibacteria group bacterium]